jgi:hypothetical protein
MQKHFLSTSLVIAVVMSALPVRAGQTNSEPAVQSTAGSEAAYSQTIEKRVADILAVLELKEPANIRSVHDILITQYRSLRDWHDANDAKRKSAKGDEAGQLKQSLKVIHEKFLASLSSELTPEQVEKVKDKMTYGKVQFTYTGYLNEYPNLSEQGKQKVLELLKEAREEAMDGGSSDEKSAIFNRYKGKINNYLSAQGVSSARKKKAPGNETNSATQKPQAGSTLLH